ncbi:hypothetical protein [Flagellimonas pacifica]|uniref:Ig-like domain-containing protein n=1 Tax=Flagellimonas pacifica TaxID=1247520 RepID=A0A285ME03_9FLAO|nr:hypothetical protein [Allomuricauda parva]SNY95402.1 hypothetical protein SAMN06265377_1070 [Allomuricauda parva]
MKTRSKFMIALFALTLITFVTAQNVESAPSLLANDAPSEINSLESAKAASISLSWCGTGPYGQVDASVMGGTGPYKWYQGGSLLTTTFSSSVTLSFGCNGGVITVKDANNNQDSDIVPQGCQDHGCN